MTSSMKAHVICPRCEGESDVEVWTSINNVESPDEAQWLIDGFLFDHECPHCGNRITLNHDCVFHDAINKVLIMYAADRTRAQNATVELESRAPEGYRVRSVHTREELREKAAIFRDGLDDRAVEAAKLALFDKFVQDGQISPDTRTYYGALAEDGGIIVEFVNASGSVEATVPRDVYDGIAASFTDAQPTVVDRAWATQVLANWD